MSTEKRHTHRNRKAYITLVVLAVVLVVLAIVSFLVGRYPISPDKVVSITKDPDGKIVWLETGSGGSRGSGLAHIIEEHGKQFNGRGISNSELPEYLLQAVHTGKVVGMQGSRPIYEFTYNGTRQRVAITVSDNGYIVGANPRSLPKED